MFAYVAAAAAAAGRSRLDVFTYILVVGVALEHARVCPQGRTHSPFAMSDQIFVLIFG